MPNRKPFRIVQLTDLHLTARDELARSEPRLFGSLRGMNAAFRGLLASAPVQRADVVLATGDITDRGLLAEWKVFWSALEAAKLPGRVLVLPGNHDVCCLGVRAPQPDLLAADLARLHDGLRLGGAPTRLPWAEQVDPRLVVFGLASSNPGNLTALTNAVGELGFFQLEAFARLLKKHRDVPVKIVALHHSPNIPRPETEVARGLKQMNPIGRLAHAMPEADRRALRLLCLSHGVDLIVHGHLHRQEDRRVNGLRIIGAPASTAPMGKGEPRRYPVYCYTLTQQQRIAARLHEIAVD